MEFLTSEGKVLHILMKSAKPLTVIDVCLNKEKIHTAMFIDSVWTEYTFCTSEKKANCLKIVLKKETPLYIEDAWITY